MNNPGASAAEARRQQQFIEEGRTLVQALGERLGRGPTACVVTFGCQMNARDSEKLSGILEEMGYALVEDEDADLLLYNTCTVRDNADQRLYGRLGRASGYKKTHPWMKLALCGCMMQEASAVEKIRKSYRFVDLIFGTHNLYRFPELICRLLSGEATPVVDIWNQPELIVEDLPAKRVYPFKSGVNIMFGCDNYCTYCIVPYVRGRERSRTPREILREIEALAADGVSEVMLLGQNVDSYGRDLPETERIAFPALLSEVCRAEGIRRVRFMTSHPKDLSPELIETIVREPKVARHIHLPLQSGSDEILRRMNRKYTAAHFLELVTQIREALPDAAITTDIIVGFPGETEADVDATIDIVRRAQFENAFTFIYSPRRGTPAAGWEQVPPEVAGAQFERVLAVVQETARERSARFTGSVQEILIESVNEKEPGLLTGRLSNNLLVHFPGDASLIGRFERVRLTECRGFYYMGELVRG